MNTRHTATILHSLSDRAQELQKKINHSKEQIETSDNRAFWIDDLGYWENRLKEVEEARKAFLETVH